jgi:hypothetical protein
MRYLVAVLGLLFFLGSASAQQITYVEYYFNEEPGLGQGTELSITPGEVVTINETLPLTGLENGRHKLFVRAKDEDGNWSTVYNRTFLKTTLLDEVEADVVYAEYYFDEEPGLGEGTELPVTAGKVIDINENIDISSLDNGRHKLFVRAKDSNGGWSTVYNRTFLKTTLPGEEQAEVAYAEYYFNEDPGLGEGEELPVTSRNVVDIQETVELAGLPDGRHKLFVRAKDSNGKWSTVYNRTFLKTTLPDDPKPQIVEVEYYFNEEPGLGNGENISVSAASEIEVEETLDISSLDIGANQLYVRAKDENGKWSQPYEHSFDVLGTLEAATLLQPDDSTKASNSPVFKWGEVEGAEFYEFVLDSVSSFDSQALKEQEVADTTLQISNLEYSTNYYWKVRAMADSSTGEWSETYVFTTKERENQPPVITNNIDEISLDEDFGEAKIAVLDTVFSDPEGLPLNFEIVEFDTTTFTASLNADTLNLQSQQDVFGNGSVIMKATDEEGADISDTLDVEILPINDLPEIINIPDTVVFRNDEELAIQLDTSFTDVEDNATELQVTLTVEPETIILEFDKENLTASLTAPEYSGEGSLMVEVTDTEGGSAQDEVIIVVEMSTSNELVAGIPNEFGLYQNYPNPFNPSTQIRFDLPKASEVMIEVYSMLGQKVATVTNKSYKAGRHTVTFDAGSLSSGMYIYRIQVGDYLQTKKMMLIK